MDSVSPLIIDDYEASWRRLTPLGREVVSSAGQAVRRSVLQFAQSHGWRVVDHDPFANWFSQAAADGVWLILDPLIPSADLGTQGIIVRLSRLFGDTQFRMEGGAIDELSQGCDVGLVDDAAVSGSTILFVQRRLMARGCSLKRVLLCATTSTARATVTQAVPDLDLQQFVTGSRRAIHLRDACAYLPFSGRPFTPHGDGAANHASVIVRAPSLVVKGGLWEHVFADYQVLVSALRARSEIAARLSAALGRAATVGDLSLLGPDVPLPAYPRQAVSMTTTLESVS